MSGARQPPPSSSPPLRSPSGPNSRTASGLASRNVKSCSEVDSNIDLVASLRQLRDCKYYWGPLSKKLATEKLANQPDGVFLLRDSSDEHHFFSLSFRMNGRTHHVRISYNRGMFCFDTVLRGTIKRPSIMDLIHTTMMQSRNFQLQYFIVPKSRYEAPVPVNICYPISRDSLLHSLKHLARQTIRQRIRLDHIDGLPLPLTLIEYLRQGQYYYEPCADSYPTCDPRLEPPIAPSPDVPPPLLPLPTASPPTAPPLPPPRNGCHCSQPG